MIISHHDANHARTPIGSETKSDVPPFGTLDSASAPLTSAMLWMRAVCDSLSVPVLTDTTNPVLTTSAMFAAAPTRVAGITRQWTGKAIACTNVRFGEHATSTPEPMINARKNESPNRESPLSTRLPMGA